MPSSSIKMSHSQQPSSSSSKHYYLHPSTACASQQQQQQQQSRESKKSEKESQQYQYHQYHQYQQQQQYQQGSWQVPVSIDDEDLMFDGKPLNLLYEENRWRAEREERQEEYSYKSRGRSRVSRK